MGRKSLFVFGGYLELKRGIGMWYDCLSGTDFLKRLYNKIPELKSVIIEKFLVTYYGWTVLMVLDMPRWVDVIPEKWKLQGYNSVQIAIEFSAVTNLAFSAGKGKRNDIDMAAMDGNMVKVVMNGGMNGEFIAEAGVIQKITGYINDLSEE